MITPTTTASFYGFDDQVIELPLITLAAYVVALKCIVKNGIDPTGQNVEAKARDLLGTPKNYAVEDILEHLREVKKQTEEYYMNLH